MAQENYALLPTYLVLDTSASMDDNGAFQAAFEFLPRLLSEMKQSSAVADKLRVEVITFDEEAQAVFPLGTREELDRWIAEKQRSPIIPDGNWTYYGKAFELLRTEIEKGVRQIRAETYNGAHFKAYRPTVFFITDGIPNDDTAARAAAFARLTDPGFAARPTIICVGVGKATMEQLKGYGAGRYKDPDHQYTAGNSSLVFVSKDGVPATKALKEIIPTLVQSIVSSVTGGHDGGGSGSSGGGGTFPDEPWPLIDDPFVEPEFEIDDDVFDLFETDEEETAKGKETAKDDD